MTAVEDGFVKAPWTKSKGRSGFGLQSDSRKMSLPQYSFVNNANRDDAGKVFLSTAHAEVGKGLFL
jgi:hypothetical protein